MLRTIAIGVVSALWISLGSLSAVAQSPQIRAIDQAVNLNVSQALERIQVRLRVNQPPTPATQASLDDNGGRLLVVHDNGAFEVWNLADGRLAARLNDPDAPLIATEFGPDGALVLLKQDGSLAVVRAGASREASISLSTASAAPLLAVHPTQPRALLAHADGTIDIVDYQANRVINVVKTGVTNSQAIAIDRSGNYAALVTSDGKLIQSDLATGLQVSAVDVSEKLGGQKVIGASFGATPDRMTLLSDTGKAIFIKNTDVTVRQVCAGCVLTSARITSAGEVINALTAGGEVVSWQRSQRGESKAKSLDLTAQVNGKVGFSATMVAVPFADGSVQLKRLGGGDAAPLILTTTRDGWISMDATGRFDGPPSARDQVNWEGTNLSATLASFESRYYEPGLLRKWASGASAKSYLTNPPPIGDGVAVPPLAAVNATITQSNTARKNLKVTVEAEDRGGGIGRIYLYHQGVLVSDRRLINEKKETVDKRNRTVMEYDVPATAGLNSFGVTAENGEGVLSPLFEQSITVEQRADKPTLHVLTVGINKYRTTRLNLDYARKDAEQLEQVVKQRANKIFSEVNTVQLFDEDVTRDNLLKAFAGLKTSTSEDTIVVYFAGHGEVLENEFYFLTHTVKYPFKAADAKVNGVSFAELEGLLSELEARKIILLLDTCKSGDALKNIDTLERSQRVLGVFGGRLGIHFLAGTDKGQLASELSTLGHGLFTYSVLEALSGKADTKPADGLVSVKEMIDYAEKTVSDLSGQYAQTAQHPTAVSRGFDFAMGRY